MADLVIRGMEMPKSCFDCIFENRFFGKIGCNNLPGMFANELHAIAYTTERNPFCPLISLPEGHGRLIDADAIMTNIGEVPYKGAVRRVLMSAPTIIEADLEWKMKNCCCFSNTDQAEGGTDNGT